MATMLSFGGLENKKTLLVFSVLLFIGQSWGAKPEQGKWIVEGVTKDNSLLSFVKSMYKGTEISVLFECESASRIKVEWAVRISQCAQEYLTLEENPNYVSHVLDRPGTKLLQAEDYISTDYLKSSVVIECDSKTDHKFLPEYNYTVPFHQIFQVPTQTSKSQPTPGTTGNTEAGKAAPSPKEKAAEGEVGNTPQEQKEDVGQSRAKRQSGNEPPPPKSSSTTAAPATAASGTKKLETSTPASKSMDGEKFIQVWGDGYYLLVFKLSQIQGHPFKVKVTVKTLWGDKYIAAVDWPLLIFYGGMGLVYIAYGIFWLFMLACNWKDLLRIQFWIGGVILLGMLEKAVFFAEYENISSDGIPVPGAIIFAELVSCFKRGLARMLVIIVSLGFGIVKPRLGQTLHKVVLAGTVYTVLASIEGCMRVLKSRADQSSEWMYAAVPLAVTDAVICWWIFSALLQTTRTLRLRRNIVKLSLYRHFTNTLIFAVIASIAYMIWFLTQHRFKECLKDWKELWVDEAFWHLLFSVILFIIMILWRPTANNQRYAFSPLLDAAEDDLEDETVLNEAYDGMKMRATKPQQRNGSPFEDKKMEDDLKWVEENIPSSIADKLLPALDSDEEIMNTKFEVSKME